MILRGLFGMGLLWLCMTQGQDSGLAFPKSPQVLERLQAIRMELHIAAQDSAAGRGEFP